METRSLYHKIVDLPSDERMAFLQKNPALALAMQRNDPRKDWELHRRPDQVIDINGSWTTLLITSGRGTGKTLTLSQTVNELATSAKRSILLIGRKRDDVRRKNIEGADGILAVNSEVQWEPSVSGGMLTWPNGSVCYVNSASAVADGRGDSADIICCDELAYYDNFERFIIATSPALRPRGNIIPKFIVVTTANLDNPKVNKWLSDKSKEPGTLYRRVPTSINRAINKVALQKMYDEFSGSEIYFRQEFGGEIILDAGDTLMIKRAMINKYTKLPDVLDSKICIVDPAVTSKDTSDYTAIGVLARKGNDYYVLHVRRGRWTPKQITENVIEVMARYRIEGLPRVEANQGGDFLKSEFSHVNMRIQKIYATRDKRERTNGVLGIFERRRIYFAPDIPEYAFDELTGFTGDPKTDLTPNDDIVDVIVHGLTQLSKGQIKKRKAIVVRS